MAFADARPGDLIALQGIPYTGPFTLAKSGTPEAPIFVCGPGTLEGLDVESGIALHVKGDPSTASLPVHDVYLLGFTVTTALQGVLVDHGERVVLDTLEVHNIGLQGVKFYRCSKGNVVQNSRIHDTGVARAYSGDARGFGEGVYVGSAQNKWPVATWCPTDSSDDNSIFRNVIGPNVTAEAVDVKEGTRRTRIESNAFYGDGMANINGASSFVEVKGNDVSVRGNYATHSGSSGIINGIEVLKRKDLPGWGTGAVIFGNTLEVHGPGYGICRSPGLDWSVSSNQIYAAAQGELGAPCATAAP